MAEKDSFFRDDARREDITLIGKILTGHRALLGEDGAVTEYENKPKESYYSRKSERHQEVIESLSALVVTNEVGQDGNLLEPNDPAYLQRSPKPLLHIAATQPQITGKLPQREIDTLSEAA